MSNKGLYIAAVLYIVALAIFMVAYAQGLDLFWAVTPIVLVTGGYIGLAIALKRQGRI